MVATNPNRPAPPAPPDNLLRPPARNPSPEHEADQRIKAAAAELAAALTATGKDYNVVTSSIDCTTIEDPGRRYAYTVRVSEYQEREIAP